MKRRKIVPCTYSLIPIEVDARFTIDPHNWLASQAQEYALTTLLAHADDGVIWGQIVGKDLLTACEAVPQVSPVLRTLTLQQARLFGPDAELLVWQDGDGNWHGRLIDDRGQSISGWCFDESQLQWGDHQEGQEVRGFTLVADGQRGLRHAVPLHSAEIPFGEHGERPLRLETRHYLEQDENDGMLIVIQSRLTGLKVQ